MLKFSLDLKINDFHHLLQSRLIVVLNCSNKSIKSFLFYQIILKVFCYLTVQMICIYI